MGIRSTALSICLLTIATCLPPNLAQAERDHHDRDRRYLYGDIRHFDRHDLGVWRRGHWYHGSHDGHFGWWWVIGTLWYFYPAPVYPYPNPYVPPVVAPPPSASPPQYYYYCENPSGYYPYVIQCPGGWRLVPTTPP